MSQSKRQAPFLAIVVLLFIVLLAFLLMNIGRDFQFPVYVREFAGDVAGYEVYIREEAGPDGLTFVVVLKEVESPQNLRNIIASRKIRNPTVMSVWDGQWDKISFSEWDGWKGENSFEWSIFDSTQKFRWKPLMDVGSHPIPTGELLVAKEVLGIAMKEICRIEHLKKPPGSASGGTTLN